MEETQAKKRETTALHRSAYICGRILFTSSSHVELMKTLQEMPQPNVIELSATDFDDYIDLIGEWSWDGVTPAMITAKERGIASFRGVKVIKSKE